MPTVGLISDTHGLLRPEAVDALEGSDHIMHAGDIMDPAILERLAAIAPVTAVRGNNDHGAWADGIPETAVLRLGATVIYAIHDLADLDVDPAAEGIHVVVSGHSHKPVSSQREGVWFVNPGSAGPRRFTLPISVGRLRIAGGVITPELIELSL
ncbi:MAG: metallophosphoesterase family protein [Burkholderiales bacterium]